MVSILSLWLPILLSSVLVFIASSIVHMMLPYHKSDFKAAPAEDDLLDAALKAGITPGDYMVPRPANREQMKDPAFMEKWKRGPVLIMTVANPSMAMGGLLLQWFLYLILVSVFAAYIASRALPPGAPYLSVFRFAGAAAFASYSLALMQDSIWYRKSWSTTIKNLFDGLIYGCLTAGVFGWLWPR